MLEFSPETHEYKLNGVILPSVTQVLYDMGLYGDAVNYFTEFGRVRGTFVHKIIQWDISQELDEVSIDPALMPYFQAWKAFRQDTGFNIHVSEQPYCSEVYRFAGTPDAIGILNDMITIIDIKTGAIGPATGLQLAGYGVLYGPWARHYALQLTAEGKYKLTQYKDTEGNRRMFLSALSLWHWKKII